MFMTTARSSSESRGEREPLLDQLLDAPHVRVHFNRALVLSAARDLRAHRRFVRVITSALPGDAFDDDVDAPAFGPLPDHPDRATRRRSSASGRRRRSPGAAADHTVAVSARWTDSIETGRFTASAEG